MNKILSQTFFARPTLDVAKDLLGKYLVTRRGRAITAGMIVETEAYVGEDDLACHASRGRTARTEGLYGKAGTAYVYLIYGMYYCFNVVTEANDFPSAVLIRAVEPTDGISIMQKRRGVNNLHALGSGPGKLCQALGIDTKMHGISVANRESLVADRNKQIRTSKSIPDVIWFEDRGTRVKQPDIVASPRVGVDYAKHCKDYPWRFYLRDNGFVSRA